MVLAHRNRVRQTSGNADVSEWEVGESRGPAISAPTAIENHWRVGGVHPNRNGPWGDALADRLQAECELHRGKALSTVSLNGRSCSEPNSDSPADLRSGS